MYKMSAFVRLHTPSLERVHLPEVPKASRLADSLYKESHRVSQKMLRNGRMESDQMETEIFRCLLAV